MLKRGRYTQFLLIVINSRQD